MAEFVQLRKEKWTEPLSQLLQLDLLNQDEFRTIILNIDKYENKIQSQSRKLEHILQYIQFECNLLITIQDRRKYLGQYENSDDIDRFIYNEIRSQFGSAEINFTHNIDFWNAKLKFVAMIVPDQDKENEFALLFKKALSYCGRANLEIYKNCVEYLWTFARKPPLDATTPRGKKRINQRRNLSTLMNNIRRITTEAVRNFPENWEASIWVLTTELMYLSILREELDFADANPKVYIPYNIQDEIDKSSKLINVIYDDLVSKNSQNPKAYIQLFDSIRMMPLPEARQLAKRTSANIVSIRNRTPEIFAWLIGRSIDDNKIDEFLERINQALCSSTFSKIKMLEMCIEKIESFLEKIVSLGDSDNCLAQLLQFYTKLLHKDNLEWNLVPSEALQTSRICFIKRLPALLDTLSDYPQDEKLINTLQSFQKDHQQREIVLHFLKIFPSSYILVKERILHILATKTGEDLKPLVILNYLTSVNWENCDHSESSNFLKYLYFAFLTCERLSKVKNLENFLKLPIRGDTMNEIRVLHLRKLYMEDVECGREFYEGFRKVIKIHWGFACEAVRIESIACRGSKEYSVTLKLALEDAVALAGTSTTEAWKVCYMCHMQLGQEREASELMNRALQNFSTSSSHYEDLTHFSGRFTSNFA